jgi:hypothetical protein
MPAPNYPTSQPAVPQPGPGTYQDDAGFNHDELHAWGAQATDQIANTMGYTGAFHFPVKLAESILITTAATISFQSIPAGYRSLRFQYLLRTNGGSASTLKVRFNNDSGAAKYAYQVLSGINVTASAFRATADSSIYISELMRTADAANMFSGGVIDIYGYADTDKNKMLISTNGWPNTGVYAASGAWLDNSAINRVDFIPTVGSFIAASSVTVWGMPA